MAKSKNVSIAINKEAFNKLTTNIPEFQKISHPEIVLRALANYQSIHANVPGIDVLRAILETMEDKALTKVKTNIDQIINERKQKKKQQQQKQKVQKVSIPKETLNKLVKKQVLSAKDKQAVSCALGVPTKDLK
ncbi:MAG: hypothetical protein F6K26_03850 [Moorea sp. SIO2I5]|nr:hypothetical protein [Moorena sp. SIO2I5]